MHRDIRQTAIYREAESLFRDLRQPGAGLISEAAEVSVHGNLAVFAGTFVAAKTGAAPTRICAIDLETSATRVLTFGPNVDRLPKFSPDGRVIGFLSDRGATGDFQLYLLDVASGAARATPRVDGWVEYFHWSPDGRRILLGVAGHGADISGGQGAVTSKATADESPSWMPTVEAGDESYHWRTAWVYDLVNHQVLQVSLGDSNIWEATWCGNTRLAAVTSPGPSEGLWYGAQLRFIEVATGRSSLAYAPKDQIGWPAASPSGKTLAIVEAICSDRWIVAGNLLIIDTESGNVRRVDTQGVDITYTEWRSDRKLLLAGHRGFATVVGVCDESTAMFSELWSSTELTSGGRYISVAGLGEAGECVVVGESFLRAPEIAIIRKNTYEVVKSFDLGHREHCKAIRSVELLRWQAPDGLEMQGWLLTPAGKGPYPLIMNIHGGPVWHWRPGWFGHPRSMPILMLIKRGYAVFLPNPRGSAGRGQEFARQVVGDLGGADMHDCLSGLDHLVSRGIADGQRLGVTGISYGGFMTAWLICQDARFRAAVAVAPHTNHVTQHLISNIPRFVDLFLDDIYTNPAGKYFQRSPVMHAQDVRTPTLNICGALDRCTPPEEAIQFHSALLQRGVESVLVTYPEEGHGIRRYPAVVDYAARVVTWFHEHMPPSTL